MKKIHAILIAPLIAVLALAAPAFAAPPYDVAVGGSTTTRDVAFTGSASSISFVVHGSPNSPMACQTVDAAGDIHAGTGMGGTYSGSTPPDHPATIDSTTWSNCLAFGFVGMTVDPTHPWCLNVTDTSVTGPPPADTQVDGYIDGCGEDLEAYVYATGDEANCNFTVTGAADGYFDEPDQELVVDEDGTTTDSHMLTVNVSGGGSTCGGAISDGDKASFDGVFAIDTDGEGDIDIQDGM